MGSRMYSLHEFSPKFQVDQLFVPDTKLRIGRLELRGIRSKTVGR